MAKKGTYRIEIPVSLKDEASKEIRKIEKMIKNFEKGEVKVPVKVDDKGVSKEANKTKLKLKKQIGGDPVKLKVKVDDKEVKKTKLKLKKGFGKGKPIEYKIKVDDTETKKLTGFQKLMKRKNEFVIGAKDRASRVVDRVQSKVQAFRGTKTGEMVLSAKDNATRVISGVRRALTSIPAMVTVGLGVVGGAKAMSYIAGGMEQARVQEHDMVRMTHWLKKDQQNMKDMTGALNDSVKFTKGYASSTAFDMAPVNAAYATALQIAGGERDEAKRLLKIAGDMAILDDGDITRSMQAIFNAQNGLYEMMDAYSPTKINKEFVDQKGGMDGLLKFMQDETGGAAEMYGKTGVGAYNTMLGKMSLFKTTVGEAFHQGSVPFYHQMSNLFDRLTEGASPFLSIIERIGQEIGNWSFKKMEGFFDKAKDVLKADEVNAIFSGGYSSQVAENVKAKDLLKPLEDQRVMPKPLRDSSEEFQAPRLDIKRMSSVLERDPTQMSKMLGNGLIQGIDDSAWKEIQNKHKDAIEKGASLVQLDDTGYAYDMRKTLEQNLADGPIPVSFKAKTETAIETVSESLSEWWSGEGQTLIVDTGVKMGEAVIDAIIAGIPKVGEGIGKLIGNQFKKAWEDPSMSNIAGAALTGGLAGYAGLKGIGKVYRGSRKMWGAGKEIGGYATKKGAQGVGWMSNLFGKKGIGKSRMFGGLFNQYKPPKPPKPPKGHNLGFMSGGGPMAGIPKWMRGGAGAGGKGLLKGIAGKLPGINVAFAGYDGFQGWKDADRRTGGDASTLDKAASALSTIAEGFTFGLVDGDKTFETLRGKKVPQAGDPTQIDPMHDIDPRMRHGMNADGSMDSRFSSAEGTTFASDFEDPMGMFEEHMTELAQTAREMVEKFQTLSEGLEGAEEFTESFTEVSELFETIRENIESMNEALEEPLDQFVENFTEISEMMEEAKTKMEELGEALEEPLDQFVENFTEVAEMMEEMKTTLEEFNDALEEPREQFVENFTAIAEIMEEMKTSMEEFAEAVQEPAQQFIENLTVVSEMLEQSAEHIEQFNEMLLQSAEELGNHMTQLGEMLVQAGETVVQAMESIGNKASEVVSALDVLIGHINTGAQAMSGLQQVQTHVNALNTAMGDLARRVSNVQVPTSIGAGGGGPVRAYAKGGIATSPHVGLVAEAGVPESMIPHDGSSRSKQLWMVTGEALGMFDNTPSSAYAAQPLDTSTSSTAQSTAGGNSYDITVPINISSTDKESIVEEAKREVANTIRLVLETT